MGAGLGMKEGKLSKNCPSFMVCSNWMDDRSFTDEVHTGNLGQVGQKVTNFSLYLSLKFL